jgi:propane monooxygenase reductase subunit
MVEAAVPLLSQLGIPEKHVYFDKFTTTGEPQ